MEALAIDAADVSDGEPRASAHDREWRDPAEVVAQWSDAGAVDGALLQSRARGAWWDVLAEAGVTLIVSREYEHLLLAIAPGGGTRMSYIRIPHPSGVAFDGARERLYVASSRNPNQVYEFGRVSGTLERGDMKRGARAEGALVPLRSSYLPGCYYIHDLAMIGGRLHANSVGSNVVVELGEHAPAAVWWPASIERDGAPLTDRNYIQLNSIAAGDDLATSFFTASGERPGRYRPGHPRYPVDRRGVLYSGATREPVLRGLTRPHSARLRAGRVWVDDSGYGEVGVAADGRFERVARLPGWTRGLAFAGNVAFVGTSRVIPRFAQYAPGLDPVRSRCAIHALDAGTGALLGSLEFPHGNQIFAIEAVPAAWAGGFPFRAGARPDDARALFYAFSAQR
jgi:uncharacterized protein (TIGR03032 family)